MEPLHGARISCLRSRVCKVDSVETKTGHFALMKIPSLRHRRCRVSGGTTVRTRGGDNVFFGRADVRLGGAADALIKAGFLPQRQHEGFAGARMALALRGRGGGGGTAAGMGPLDGIGAGMSLG